jgi:thiaminase (transcriptional activator TenA)
MSLCAQMRSDSARIWDGLHAHPFLRELAQGTLAPEKFRFFLEQDIFYLQDYARCLAMGAAKARDEVELGYFVTDLNQVIEAELPTNRQLLASVIQLGAPDAGGALMQAPANLAYTSYMQSLSLRGGALEIMAVLLPCAWSYVEIAQRLAGETSVDHPVYSPWIGYFSAPQNVAMVDKMKRDMDSLVEAEGLNARRREELGEIFANSSRLEHGFWDMAYNMIQWPDLRPDPA